MTQLGKYTLHEILGKGGFGVVWRATDTILNRVVAVKILHPQLALNPDFISSFRREAQVIAALEHPNIVAIHDLSEVDGRFFLVMKYLPGGSLADRIRQGPLPFPAALALMEQVCAGLQQAHEKGWVHRDIKPANILFDADGRAVVGDFGLTKILSASTSSSSGMGGAGTPFYRAPEVWRGKPPVSPATDVYALGCIFYEMLVGTLLFPGETTDEIITRHLIEGPAFDAGWPPSGVPAGIDAVLRKALAKDPAERHAHAAAFLQALKEAAQPRVESSPAPAPKPEPAPAPERGAGEIHSMRAGWWKWAAGCAAVLLLVAAVLVMAVLTQNQNRAARIVYPASPTAVLAAVMPTSTAKQPTAAPTVVMPEPTETRAPTPTTAPAILGGGSGQIAFVSMKDGISEVFLAGVGGSDIVQLTNNPAYAELDHPWYVNHCYEYGISWSPDGKKLAYSSSQDGSCDIFVINADGSNPVRLTNSSITEEGYPAWSPDGKKILYTTWALYTYRMANLYTMNTDGSDQKKLTTYVAKDGHPAWSPDGKYIAYESARPNGTTIYIMNADGTNETQLTMQPGLQYDPDWSPDGRQIVFTSRRDGDDEIYLINADGSNERKVTNNDFYDNDPDWSPDGKQIVFISNRDGNRTMYRDYDGLREIYVMNADGTDQRRLLVNPGTDDFSPTWRP